MGWYFGMVGNSAETVAVCSHTEDQGGSRKAQRSLGGLGAANETYVFLPFCFVSALSLWSLFCSV